MSHFHPYYSLQAPFRWKPTVLLHVLICWSSFFHCNFALAQSTSLVTNARQLIQSHELWGYLAPMSSNLDTNRMLSCFMGLGLTRCSEVSSSDPASILDYGYSPYKWSSMGDASGNLYCFECCQNTVNYLRTGPPVYEVACGTETSTDTYNGQFLDTNLKDYEFRFARRRFETDVEVVSCPLIRDDSGSLSSAFQPELVGYELEIVVQEYNSGMSYWRGVESCTATGIMVKSLAERQLNLHVFTEKVAIVQASDLPSASRSIFDMQLLPIVLCSILVFRQLL